MTIIPKYRYTNVIARSSRLIAHANVIHRRFEAISFAPFLKYLIDIAPSHLLDILADEFSLTVYEGWSASLSEEKKRLMLKESIELHRHKGTAYSIKQILAILGFGNVAVLTGLNRLKYDGTGNYDGAYFYGEEDKWAYYRIVFLSRPIANSQISMIKKILESFAPAHMALLSLNYERVAVTYNGLASFDGNFNFGEVLGG